MINRPIQTAALAASFLVCAFATAAKGAENSPPPLGLPRLAARGAGAADLPSLMGADRFEVDTLRIDEGPTEGGALLMMSRDTPKGRQWQPLGIHAPFDFYEGRILAGLPVLTVRLDPAEATWDLYVGTHPAAAGLPLLPRAPNDTTWTLGLRAGRDGARLYGLVQASESPLFDDVNDNGVDDAFERRKRGALARAGAPARERTSLAREWRADPGVLPTLVVKRPLPDGN